jgi:phage terminase small subunit
MPVLDNARHERFAQALAKGETADAAYVSAGFSANRGNAARLNANESVRKRVAELQAKAAEKAVVTVEDIARQLDEDRDFARTNGSAAAAVAATLGKAKVLGLVVDKAENVNYNVDVTDEPASEEDWAAEHRPN